jgi:hypothetical protein
MPEDLEIVKEIIENSGNTFHCNVLKYLQEKDWTMLISPYYSDNVSNKPREIDLIAEKAFAAKDSFGRQKGVVCVKLFIECKYISQKSVLWFHDKDMQKAEDLVIQTTPARRDNIYTKQFHYLEGADTVAKLFADERKKSAENEIFYKALNQSLNAMVYYRGKESIIKISEGRRINILKTLNYPVIVCNSFENLFRVDIGADADPSHIAENFQLEVNYAYLDLNGASRTEYFLIDTLSFDLFDRFLEQIEKDANIVSFFLDDI